MLISPALDFVDHYEIRDSKAFRVQHFSLSELNCGYIRTGRTVHLDMSFYSGELNQ
ncbi:hypothetical protein [Curtobacterium ammoniigenes]|uniref:hypothetical protein n=1 Tax=Curtobacterium ammoniigenes TaxID=395387 RepID=UPI000B0F695D|nr:hypothetical protein [Curtobacterium ammoniigenes]